MALSSYFSSMAIAPLSVKVGTRDASTYLLRSLFIMGIRPLPKKFGYLYILWSFIINFTSLVYLPVSFVISYIIHMNEFAPGELLTSIQIALNTWSYSADVIIVWLLCYRFDLANNVLDELDKRCKLDDEQKKIRSTAAWCNRISFLDFLVFVFGFTTSTFIGAMINGHPPYQNYYPFIDWRTSRLHFWIQSLHEYFAMCCAFFQQGCIDLYPVLYIILLRMHIQILKERISNLGTDASLSDAEHYEELVNCILDHKTLLRYCDVIRPLISYTIFIQFTIMGIVIGLTFLNIWYFSDGTQVIGVLVYLGGVLMETTPLCVLCSYLIDDCVAMANAVFFIEWINKEKRYKKTVIYFLQKVQQPIIFNAFNFVPITVKTMIGIVKFSFSVFTLVREMKIMERLTEKAENAGNSID